ncbi:MAG: RecQ family ATP-dependent DNA helicase [Bacteroidota bacterium]
MQKYWGYSSFRPLQEDIVLSVAAGNDTLALMPTGGGKSITFQVPALAKEGICIVVTPLIALMKDQVENLRSRNIKAVAIYSGMSYHEIDTTLNNCVYGNYKFLYVSPERLGTDLFRERVRDMKVNLLAVDESHCISQWGYDFRPSYLLIANIRELIPAVPVLAVTATATPRVVDDIQEKLKFSKKNVFRKSFERKNLVYIVRKVEDKHNYLLKRLQNIRGSGVVYVRNRKETREFAEFLTKNGISADYYHAGLDNKTRDAKQYNWKTGKTRIIVSTNAFGMGIDKPDVRFVAHIDLPDSLEAYFQEAGRGGRDEKTAFAVLLYDDSDIRKLEENFENSFPEIPVIKQVYNSLGNFFQIPVGAGKGQSFDFNIALFAKNYRMDVLTVYNSLKFLERGGYIETTDMTDNPSKVMIRVDRDELYDFQLKNQKYDNFIKLILRMYSGLFHDFININEDILAKAAGIKKEHMVKALVNLDKMEVIRYIPARKSPLIIYIEERLSEKSLVISHENYHELKKKNRELLDGVTGYVSNNTKCRSQQLLSYFGETDSYRCGNCDVCRMRNELNMSKYEFDLILEKLKEILMQKPVLLPDLVAGLDFREEKISRVLGWLLDNDKVYYTIDNKLAWRKKSGE